MSDITNLLDRLESGDGHAAVELFPLVYDELRRLAKWKLADEKAGNTLQPTALVNEVYLRLVGAKRNLTFESRSGFFSAAAEAMRHILVDAARRKLALKRGGDLKREYVEIDRILVHRPNEILSVHQALEALTEHDPCSAEVVKLHYFGGYSFAEIADLLNLSRSAANRSWVYARAWLKTNIESQSIQTENDKFSQ
jgi:RNA polymerase sigma factor (TIGR02999 family)